jgi:hypothetical protein
VQSPEDLEQVSRRKVGYIQSVNVANSRKDANKLPVIDADEIMQTRQVGDEVLSGLEAEDIEHEILGNDLERVDPRRRSESTRLPLKGPLRRIRPRSLIRLADTVDDQIVALLMRVGALGATA